MNLFLKNILPVSLFIGFGLSLASCDLINQDVGPFYHSYASIGISADTVQVGSTVEATICIWNHGNELYDLKETVQDSRVEFMVLLKGTKPEPVFCPVGTGTILLNRSYTLSKPGTFTFSMAQPDGQFQDRVVVVE